MAADDIDIGPATYNTRVERWECDYNNHWNVRFYGRSFERAADVIGTAPGTHRRAGRIGARHIRFHRELFVSAPVEIRSAILQSGPHAGAIAHVLSSAGRYSATALDFPDAPGFAARALPGIAPQRVPLALPRGLDLAVRTDWPAPLGEQTVTLGPVCQTDTNNLGELTFEFIVRLFSVVSHFKLAELGMTPDFSNRTGINRMGVEFMIRQLAHPPVGTVLCGEARLTAVKGKRFWKALRLYTEAGEAVATMEQCLVAVDLNTRRATEVPEILYQGLK